jgi:hypothetical protein
MEAITSISSEKDYLFQLKEAEKEFLYQDYFTILNGGSTN